MKISVIIAAYNEINTIEEVLRRVGEVDLEKEIIVVDDGSTDGTSEILKNINDPNVKVITHLKNKGKGAALRTALRYACGEIIIIQDADLEYYPNEYPQLIKPIVDNRADVVYGSRFIGTHRVYLFYHYLGNKLINFIANILFDTTLTDLMTGYKAFKTSVIKNLDLKANGFGIEAEITAEIFKRNLRVYETPISYNGRTYEEGKKITKKDFFIVLYWLIRSKFIPFHPGLETLLRMNRLKNYNLWIFENIKPFLGKKILEIGAGIGNITKYILDKELIVATDVSGEYIIYLKNRFFISERKLKILKLDITVTADHRLDEYEFDTVLCLNVLEHIQDDKLALKNIYGIMKKGARLILLVPAMKNIYGNLDEKLNHFRRYGKNELITELLDKGFIIERTSYFNLIGAFGWFLSSKLIRRKVLPRFGLFIFDQLVPIIKLERFFRIPFGLSLIVIAKK